MNPEKRRINGENKSEIAQGDASHQPMMLALPHQKFNLQDPLRGRLAGRLLDRQRETYK
jgi:endoglucanase Acf2